MDLATPDEIIQKLISSDYRTALDGLSDYIRLSEDQRTPAIKSALVQALRNENERVRSIISQRGEDLPVYQSEGGAEGTLLLMEEVYELRDPSTIPVLLPWCQTGGRMVDFGRVALEPLLKYLEEPPIGTTRHQIGSCMYTLRMMVDYWGVTTLTSSQHQRMRLIAEKYIENSVYYTMSFAISLAASLQETSLLQMVQTLINDDAEMAKRQVWNIDRLRQITSQALAGTLVERQYMPYDERQERGY